MSSRVLTSAPIRSLYERVRRAGTMRGVARLRRRVRTTVAITCFWLAVLLPVAYVPLLVGGFRAGEGCALLGLLVVHAVMLYAGHEGHGVPANANGP